MKKELTFIKKAIPEAKALEQSLADLLLSKDYAGAFSMYRDIADSLDERARNEGPFVVTDINPIRRMLEVGGYGAINSLSSQLLPFSPEGIVIIHGGHNPASIGTATAKYLGNMPSWQESLSKNRHHSTLFSISNRSEFESVLNFYRGERRIEYMRAGNYLKALGSAPLDYVGVWGNSDNFMDKNDVVSACLDVLQLIQSIDGGMEKTPKTKMDYNNRNKEYAARYLIACLKNPERAESVLSSLLKIASTKSVTVCFDQSYDAALVNVITMNILVQSDTPGDGWSGKITEAVIDKFCIETSRHCKMSPEKIFVKLMEDIIEFSKSQVNFDFSKPFSTGLKKEKIIKEFNRRGSLGMIQRMLKWDEIWAVLPPSDKKQIITEELGM
jgi:hypothetical protein